MYVADILFRAGGLEIVPLGRVATIAASVIPGPRACA